MRAALEQGLGLGLGDGKAWDTKILKFQTKMLLDLGTVETSPYKISSAADCTQVSSIFIRKTLLKISKNTTTFPAPSADCIHKTRNGYSLLNLPLTGTGLRALSSSSSCAWSSCCLSFSALGNPSPQILQMWWRMRLWTSIRWRWSFCLLAKVRGHSCREKII